jgi:hypothetical protein
MSASMNWYKRASINPWSIFEEVPREGDSDSVIQIDEERLGKFVNDVTGNDLFFIGYFNISGNEANFSVAAKQNTDNVIPNVLKVISSLETTNLFSAVNYNKITNFTYSIVINSDHKFKPCNVS